jgi:hypothetical protein
MKIRTVFVFAKENSNLWQTLDGLFASIGNLTDESDFCICQDRLTLQGGGYISCEDCTET